MNLRTSVTLLLFATTAAISGVAQAIPSLSFIIDGDTFGQPYSITNNSTGGESVVRFNLNLGTIPSGGPFCFDTVSGGPAIPRPNCRWLFQQLIREQSD